ncbi:YALI0B08921p [Yarrowia lipolytica CLIB122]|uniref:Superoxide dismutase n=2 Tax=Yarrowia lipolytica TaxID=4952 RepID=Q6CFA1_YARLI|nr:YALI0B08921p [Yarrowia lipolytica CLIB122]KAB8281653.1 Manganese/iron superoxide dismutase [Yarrowia lipolytica]KAE8171342.1 Manganese/iron superoxide dismutase [Yarrowia lipolytica]KAJ8052261.1 Manganese/iron superoxide dismutase [Yarrowia lipolytica]RMJ01000.1 Manganese/iron superoxide dismutase [Yarrowia lipolytica]UBT70840.1 aaa [Yarrowia lipolytica]|eukprot:XP_500661.1 YALI0B08921p [Yarrowia lipolytica CLIB122]
MLARNTLRQTIRKAQPMAGRTLTTAVLPKLDYDFGALEPFVAGQINEIHYTKHHQTYVNSFNAASEQLASAEKDGDLKKIVELQNLINFHGGGHINHSLWWKNLAPKGQGGGELPSPDSPLGKAIKEQWGDANKLIETTNAALAGVQGSGWAWIVKNKLTGDIEVITKQNQDPVAGNHIPLVGIDAWEHAYYLQYKNVKADYFKAIWNVINWQEAEKRFLGEAKFVNGQ